ncbi:MAG: sugar ABC transporter permease [Thermodesulfobacteriota bacterium]|nr:sugar ABC transporter permease [Thermodesulfobacteriota bacterium]
MTSYASILPAVRNKGILVAIKRHFFGIMILAPAVLYLGGFLLIILFKVVTLALTHSGPQGDLFPTARHFVRLSATPEFQGAFVRTVWFTLIGTPLELIVGIAAAFLVVGEFKGRGVIRSIMILPLAIPSIVTAIMLYIVFDFPGGHVNDLLMGRHAFFPFQLISHPLDWRGSGFFSLTVALFGKVWRDMPISMLIILAGLQAIGKDQYEAAKTLGANAFQTFFRITLPLLTPAISTVLVLRSIEVWKEFIFPFILAGSYPLLATLIDRAYHEWRNPHEACAIALILLILIVMSTVLIFYVLKWLRRRLVKV